MEGRLFVLRVATKWEVTCTIPPSRAGRHFEEVEYDREAVYSPNRLPKVF